MVCVRFGKSVLVNAKFTCQSQGVRFGIHTVPHDVENPVLVDHAVLVGVPERLLSSSQSSSEEEPFEPPRDEEP